MPMAWRSRDGSGSDTWRRSPRCWAVPPRRGSPPRRACPGHLPHRSRTPAPAARSSRRIGAPSASMKRCRVGMALPWSFARLPRTRPPPPWIWSPGAWRPVVARSSWCRRPTPCRVLPARCTRRSASGVGRCWEGPSVCGAGPGSRRRQGASTWWSGLGLPCSRPFRGSDCWWFRANPTPPFARTAPLTTTCATSRWRAAASRGARWCSRPSALRWRLRRSGCRR